MSVYRKDVMLPFEYAVFRRSNKVANIFQCFNHQPSLEQNKCFGLYSVGGFEFNVVRVN